MDKNYQINLPPGMLLTHPDSFITMTPFLAAAIADRVFLSSKTDIYHIANMQENSMLSAMYNDIFSLNLSKNQKKEVNDSKMNLKHCKTIQYEMRLSKGQKFFNN